MRLGIKAKQVFGVTTIVGVTVTVLSLMHLARLAQVRLDESRSRAQWLSNAIFHRAREVVRDRVDPSLALAEDSGLKSLLESSIYSDNVTYAAIVDTSGRTIAAFNLPDTGVPLAKANDLGTLMAQSSFSQLREVYRGQGRNFELSEPLLIGDAQFGSIRIGVSTLLVRRDLDLALRPAALTALIAISVAVFFATVLAQLLLRPIHVIRSGLTRLGKGEFGVRLDLNQQDEFGELGTFFNTVSAQLSADRSQMAGQVANLESAVERLEDAVAIINQNGEFLFANPAMRAILPAAVAGTALSTLVPSGATPRSRCIRTKPSRSEGVIASIDPAGAFERASAQEVAGSSSPSSPVT